MATYTLGQWLKGKVDFNLTDSNIYSACVEFGITPDKAYSECTEREKDLSLANIYELVSVSSSVSSGEYDSDGGWQHRSSAKNVVNRGWFSAEAERLRKKWGVATTTSGKVTIKDLY